ncbi:polyprenyl synthetase family protein [Bifidobacterium saguinibicoloris]|uniref:polyprenyl synthetase family protein n=1 Tax=Bifidobacterium saguinibicoloris TaxID=2834433 RepID=UPI001C563B99|nr:polyprenyl synthetase family protein [Bifidobacterium saguinibicoloris]MBW3080537.1 polyprenyl synthetase family protein [Bifidobacterium saguinibicoloris]
MHTTDADRALIEPRITALVAQHTGVPEDVPGDDAVPRVCRDMMDGVVAQGVASSEGGKRLRALLALSAYDAFGGVSARRGAMVDLACAIEVFQTAALVHDDIIDESDLRRGRPSAHKALEDFAGNVAVGRGLGLMLGDLLATACVSIANDAAGRLPNSPALVDAFLNMQREVEIGQVLDLAVEQAPLDEPDSLVEASLGVFRWKTASYTTIAPLELALLAVGAPAARARELALAVGRPLGLAFQLEDDLIDVTGSSRTSGKPVGGDIREGKRTVLLADAIAGADGGERDELIAMFEAERRDAHDVRRAIDLFTSTGAVARSRARIAELWDETRLAIAKTTLNTAQRASLTAMCARFVPDVAGR